MLAALRTRGVPADDISLKERAHDRSRAGHALVDVALVLDAGREWSATAGASSDSSVGECTDLLRLHGLCEPALLRVPEQRLAYTRDRPFMLLHLQKCAGTSLLNALGGERIASQSFTKSASAVGCADGTSARCCWWQRQLRANASKVRRPKVLTQEPANVEKSLVNREVVSRVDGGFDAAQDLCTDELAYATVLRPPVERVHSLMCELGVNFSLFQDANVLRPGHVSTQQRDNYLVRSLGGAEAWDAPEGGLRARHLRAAAATLARFDVVMTVATLARDAPAQMGRVGLPGFAWPRTRERSRADNLQRAARLSYLRSSGVPSCDVRPTAPQLARLVAASAWDAALYEFARLIAERRTQAYRRKP